MTADNIDIPGLLVNGGAAEGVSLVANVGTIAETGTLIAGGLVGSAVGHRRFVRRRSVDPSNQIGRALLGSAGKLRPGSTASSVVLRDGIRPDGR